MPPKATPPPEPPVPEGPPPPPLQQDVHFVLQVVAKLKPPVPQNADSSSASAEAQQPEAVAAPSGAGSNPAAGPAAGGAAQPGAPAAEAAGETSVDPKTLSLQLRFKPWAGDEIIAPPAPLSDAGAAGVAADSAPQQQQPAQQWACTHHFKSTVDEAFVRAMAEQRGLLNLPVVLTQPPPEPPPKPVKGQPPPPEPVIISFTGLLPLDCSGLLVGDTSVSCTWPSKLRPVPKELATLVESVTVSFQALSMPEKTPEELAAEAAAAAKAKKDVKKDAKAPAKGGKGAKDAPPEPDLSAVPGEPIKIMTPDLALRLNPIVVLPLRANSLPDAPATAPLLDGKCEAIRLRVCWPPKTAPREQLGRVGSWRKVEEKLSVRAVGFGEADIILAGDFTVDQLMQWCKESPLALEVHDRTAVPDPPEFPIAQEHEAEAGAGAQDDEGYVCGLARVPLLDLVRGATRVKFTANMQPHTTIRGAASLDWQKRPGNYAQACSVVKGVVRCAVPLAQTVGVAPAERVLTRAVFVMDYRDSELFHTLEDTVRRQNALRLGLADPVLPSPKQRAEEQIQKQRSASAESSKRPSYDGNGAPAASVAGRGPTTAHSTTSIIPGAPQPLLPDINAASGRGSLAGQQRAAAATAAASVKAQVSPSPVLPSLTVPRASMPSGAVPSPRAAAGAVSAAPNARVPGRLILKTASSNGQGSRTGGMASPGKKELRFTDFDGLSNGGSSDGSDDEDDAPLTATEQALEDALAPLECVPLDMRLLQSLSTFKLTAEQAGDPNLDIMTGFHLVDGKERVIVVEGRHDGAMQIVRAIIDWALDEAVPEEGWRRRQVLYNASRTYSTRLWADLGVDLYIVKLRASVPKIIAEAGSYATGKVRVDCIEGLRRLGQLRSTQWARLADDLNMYPTPHMIHLVDKKFGGELTKADVFGVEAEEFQSDEDDGGQMHLVQDGDAKSSASSKSKKSARSRRSAKSAAKSRRSARKKQYVRKHPALSPLDHRNAAYVMMREEARQRRLAADWNALHVDTLSGLKTRASTIREQWATWNPQRAAAKALEQQIAAGTLTLQDTILQRSRKEIEPIPGTITQDEARTRGWCPHHDQFKWPAPKEAGTYNVHPHRPSQFRTEQLAEQWVEGEMYSPLSLRQMDPDDKPFITTVKNPNGLFGQDPEFWKTVHIGGQGRAQELEELKAKEKEDFTRRLVVEDPVMHTTLPVRNHPSQTDRNQHMLQDSPKKKGFTVSHAPPAPISMQLSEPYKQATPGGVLRSKDDPTKYTAPGQDFKRHLAKEKRQIVKPGLDQSWTAALHDQYYNETE